MKYVYINECLARINGLPTQDHIGKDMREILPPVAAGVEEEMLQVLETGEPVVNSTRTPSWKSGAAMTGVASKSKNNRWSPAAVGS